MIYIRMTSKALLFSARLMTVERFSMITMLAVQNCEAFRAKTGSIGRILDGDLQCRRCRGRAADY